MNKGQYVYIIRCGVAVVAATLLLLPVVMRTEATPSAQDAWSFRSVAALCGLAAAMAVVSVCLGKGKAAVRLHWMDGAATLWWLYVTANYWFLSPYPAREAYWEATALWMAYAGLRLLASLCGTAWQRTWTCGLLVAGAYEAFAGWGQLLGLAESHHYQYALTGTYFNPGPYGIFLASVVAVAWAAGSRLRPVDGTDGRCRLRDMFRPFRQDLPPTFEVAPLDLHSRVKVPLAHQKGAPLSRMGIRQNRKAGEIGPLALFPHVKFFPGISRQLRQFQGAPPYTKPMDIRETGRPFSPGRRAFSATDRTKIILYPGQKSSVRGPHVWLTGICPGPYLVFRARASRQPEEIA